MSDPFNGLAREIRATRSFRNVGRISAVKVGVLEVENLADHASIGDRVIIHRSRQDPLAGEIVQIESDTAFVLPDSVPDGVALGDRAMLHGVPKFAPGDHWIGRVVDPYGQPLDGRPLPRGDEAVKIMASPPPATLRRPLGQRLATGLAILNTLLPVVEGQRVGLFAGSGVGKSRLLAQLARNMQADVVVIALVGERGREVGDFVERVLGPDGMKRSVVVAATSDRSAVSRRRCAWAAMSVAEHFRDKGHHVLLLADSITRFAEAHREIAVSGGEAPALRGFPPSTVSLITSLCERAGPGARTQGVITAIFSVLVAGSDMDEPVADILRGVLDGHIVLSREIAERGRFPAIDVGKSVSRSLPEAASEGENRLMTEIRRLLRSYENAETMIRAGLYSEGSDPILDQAVRIWPGLDEFFASHDHEGIQSSFDRLGLLLRRSMGSNQLGGANSG